MEIDSTRFGRIVVDETRVITFPAGLVGFPDHNHFALVQTGEETFFFWLQSLDDPSLAFVLTDPTLFFKTYAVPLRDEARRGLQVDGPAASDNAGERPADRSASSPVTAEAAAQFLQVFVICNRVDDWLTGNLLGPIVVNANNRLAQQVVLTEKKWTTRQPLLRLRAELPLAKSA